MTNIRDVVVIGGGIGGVTAAIYAKRNGLDVLLIEKNLVGGQILNAGLIENYPAIRRTDGSEFGALLGNQLSDLEIEVIYREVTKLEDGEDYKAIHLKDEVIFAKSLVLALGLTNRKLGLTNEERFIGFGISNCVFCDGFFYKDKKVAVIGGGNSALDAAMALSDIAKKVYLIHRRETFRGNEETVKKLRTKNNVEFILNSEVKELMGSDHLEKIRVVNADNEEQILEVAGLFVLIGQITKSSFLKGFIELDPYGYILVDKNMMTTKKGIFSVGDANNKEIRQLTTSASDGTIAGIKVSEYIKELRNEKTI